MLSNSSSTLVNAIRAFRAFCQYFSDRSVLGVPLDWIIRFVTVGGLYLVLQTRLKRRTTLAMCVLLLLAKEGFDILAHRNWHPRLPDRGDVADVLSGLAGLAVALGLTRLRRR